MQGLQEPNGKLLSSLLVNLVVPQGSIRGLSLFLMNVYDPPNCINTSQAITFADDTNSCFNGDSYSKLYEKKNEQLQKVDS